MFDASVANVVSRSNTQTGETQLVQPTRLQVQQDHFGVRNSHEDSVKVLSDLGNLGDLVRFDGCKKAQLYAAVLSVQL